MTGALDTTARANAGRLIDKYGKALTFTAEGVYDAATDDTTPGAGPYSWNGVLDRYENAFPKGSTEKFGSSVVYTPAINTAGTSAGFTPEPGWSVTVDSAKFKVQVVHPVYSGELVALWILEVAGA